MTTTWDALIARFAQELAQRRAELPHHQVRTAAQLLPYFQVSLPDPDSATGTFRRLRIHVPTPDGIGSSIALGRGVGGLFYDGIGAKTSGHIYLDACGGKPASTMSLLANGRLLIQSDLDSLYLASGGPSALLSSAATNLFGGGGVNIVAGAGQSVTNTDESRVSSRAGPPSTVGIKAQLDSIGRVVTMWGAVDGAVAAACLVRAGVEAKMDPKLVGWRAAADFAKTLGNLSALGCVANNALGVAGANALGGVTIHGDAGWLLGTPLYGSAYALAGLTIGSLFPLIIGLKDAEMVGIHNAKLTSAANAGVLGGKQASVVGGTDTEVAARSATLTLLGKDIRIGDEAPAPPQSATQHVRVRATERIALGVGLEKTDGKGVFVDTPEDVWINGKKTVRVLSDKSVEVKCGKDVRGLFADDASIDLSAKQARLLLNGSGGIGILSYKGKSKVAVDDGSASLVHGSNMLSVSSSGAWTLKGSKFKIL